MGAWYYRIWSVVVGVISAIFRAVDVAMSTKVQDVFERNPGGHLRCSCALVCDDCSIELFQRDPWVRVCHGVPH